MNDTLSFQDTLAEVLEKRREWIDRGQMPRLKDAFRMMLSSFTGLRNVLLKKGILHEDPYKNDAKIADIQVPPEGGFTESEKNDQMSLRLSAYESQLDFLLSFYQFSVDFLTMERIKRIVSLTKYFNWVQFSSNSPSVNTRALAEIVGLIKNGNDALSIGLVADSLQVMDRTTKNALGLLKEVSDYRRELYKLELRRHVMGAFAFDPGTVIVRRDETMRQIKKKFAEAIPNTPFYPELVDELLKEDYSGEGPALRDELLARLAVKEDKPKEEKRVVSFKATLMDGLRTLGLLNFTFDDAARKLGENSALLESDKKGFMESLRRLVRRMMNLPPEKVIYEIEYFDAASTTSKTQQLDFTAFRQDAERKARFLASINNKTAALAKKMEAANEEQTLAILTKTIEELQTFHRTMTALDVFFKSEAPRELRERMRGIKPELSGIRNGIIKANQKRHEYIAQKEEMEQMKKLGIRTDVV